MTGAGSGRRVGRWVGLLVSAGLLALIAVTLDAGAVVRRLAGLEPLWALAGLALATLQVVLSAWRWRFTAARLGLGMGRGLAVREYYLATFLNQVLPGGVAGDVSRAWRHGSRPGPGSPGETARGRAVRAVVLERLSGQLVMAVAAVVSLVVLVGDGSLAGTGPAGDPGAWRGLVPGPRAALVVVGGAGALALAWALLRRRGVVRDGLVHRLARDTWVGLLSPRTLPVQLVTSGLVVASYLGLGVVAARAVGVDTPTASLLPLMAPVLLAMLVPVGVGGWGVREGAAAVVWSAAGLPAADGVATFVAYGALALVASLPGAVLVRRNSSARSADEPEGDREEVTDGSGGNEEGPTFPSSVTTGSA